MKKYISRYKNGDWLYTIILISCIIVHIIIRSYINNTNKYIKGERLWKNE